MSFEKRGKIFLSYLILAGGLFFMAIFLRIFPQEINQFLASSHRIFYSLLAILFFFSFFINRLAPATKIPAFVWSIFFGIALQPVLAVLEKSGSVITLTIELIAAYILFDGGVEISFRYFKKWVGVIASLSFIGTILTALFFAVSLSWIFNKLNIFVPAAAIALVSAILSSTDPAAIIPSLEQLKFKRPYLKLIAVSESATNDVVGVILTRFILIAITGAVITQKPIQYFFSLAQQGTVFSFFREIVIGLICGFLGFLALHYWTKHSKQKEIQEGTDTALYFSVPLGVFALGGIFGGSGFLGTFLTGLFFEAETHTKKIVDFFENFVQAFGKPIIFLLLGSIVPLEVLFKTSLIGILAAFIFIFIIRPLVVFITLGPWIFQKNSKLNFADLLFLSFIRETGVIPAALIVMIGTTLPYADYLFGIGMWVILLTLLIEPPLTPYIAKKLAVAV